MRKQQEFKHMIRFRIIETSLKYWMKNVNKNKSKEIQY